MAVGYGQLDYSAMLEHRRIHYRRSCIPRRGNSGGLLDPPGSFHHALPAQGHLDVEWSGGRPVSSWSASSAVSKAFLNSAHWPTKENRQKLRIFYIFPAHAKNGPRWPQMGLGGFFPTNPDLADILGRTDFDFENFYFFDLFGFQIS